MPSPTAITMSWMRRQGYEVGIVERYLAHVERPDGGRGIRKDLFGVIDIVACKPGEPVLGVQCTSVTNVSSRIAKAKAVPELRVWLASGARFVVMGWRKNDKGRWVARIEEITLDAMQAITVATIMKPARKRRASRYQTSEALFQE